VHSSRNRRADYWKSSGPFELTRREVTQLFDNTPGGHQAFGKTWKLPRLKYLVTRVQRGLRLYDNCDIAELEACLASRGLLPLTLADSSHKNIKAQKLRLLKQAACLVARGLMFSRSADSALEKMSKADMIRLLEQADDNATFKHLLALPVELRLRIYSFYYASIDDGEWYAPPPITEACHLVRGEALPLFYRSRVHTIDLDGQIHLSDDREYALIRFSFFPDRRTTRFFTKAPQEQVPMIRHLHINIDFEFYAYYVGCNGANIKVDLGANSRPANHQFRYVDVEPGKLDTVLDWQAVQSRLQEWLDHFDSRPEGKALQRRDLRGLIEVLKTEQKM